MPDTLIRAADASRLIAFAQHALEDAGVDPEAATTTADAMVSADARGQHTHGVWYLPRYVAALRGGGINPAPEIRVLKETPATAVIDGDGGLGAVVTTKACEIAADKAKQVGCATVLVNNSNHFGAASCYSLMLAERGCIGFVTANSEPAMAPPRGRTRVIGTQPVSYATPDPDGLGPVMLDMALTVVAGTRVRQAHVDGEQIPSGWVVDANGRDTTNPADLFEGGALAPVAGHKGYGLAILTEILAGVLSGAGITRGVHSNDREHPSQTGHCVIALDIEAFMPEAEFSKRLAALRAELHAAPVDAEPPHAIMPGEPEFNQRQRSETGGVSLAPVIWDALAALATELGREQELEATQL